MKITKGQKKLIEQLYGKGDFLEVDEILYYKVSNDNTTYRVDFDKSVYKSGKIDTTDQKKKKIEESEIERQTHEDLTMEQVKENYYHETDHAELDSSHAMFETRVAKEMEARGISREQAFKEVKQKLAQKGVSVINTEDMDKKHTKEKDDDDYEEMEEDDDYKKKHKKDMETLTEENKKLKADLEESKKTKEDMIVDFETFKKETKDFMDKIQKEREAESEVKRQEKIKQIMTDFVGITEEKLKEKTLDQLNEQEEILTMALKKDIKEEEEAKTTDMQTHLDLIDSKAKALSDKYRCDP